MNNTYNNDNFVPGEIDHGTLYKAIDKGYGQDAAKEIVKCLNGIEFEGQTPDVLVAKALADLKHDLALKAKALRARIRCTGENLELTTEYMKTRRSWFIVMKRYGEIYPAALAEAKKTKHPVQYVAAV